MAIGRVYTATFQAVAVTAVQDLIAIVPGSNKPIEILEWAFSQITRVGDANEVQLLIAVKTGATATGSGGTTAAPIANNLSDTASGATVRYNDTTPAGTGTIVTPESWNWNVRMPFQRIYLPEERPLIPVNRFVLGLLTAPPASITISGICKFQEFG